MIKILTDSCADLSAEIIQAHEIQVLPLLVYINGQTIPDGSLPIQDLFNLVEKSGQLPKTSAVPLVNFIQAFAGGEDTLFIGISSKLSATISNALLAAEQTGAHNLSIVDSLNLSTGIGLLVMKAVDLRDQGRSLAEIVQAVGQAIPKVHTSFLIDTMDYLYKGGRCTALQAIFGSMLKIRPVIFVRNDGTLGVKDKIRGTRQKALQSMLADFESNREKIDLKRVFITHTGCDEDAAYLAGELKQLAPVEDLIITHAGATIASHCGPGTIGILYLEK